MIEAVAKTAYARAYENPIRMKKGDRLKIGSRDPENPGWIWAEHADGRSGWVPEEYISELNGEVLANRDYNALELSIKTGDKLKVLLSESGWVLCTNSWGEKGWVPESCIEFTDALDN